MRNLAVIAILPTLLLSTSAAFAHAFLDHARPVVGSSVSTPPRAVTLWFTQNIESAFSGATVSNQAGDRVDLGNAHVPRSHPDQLVVRLKPLSPGTYKVRWHVLSVDSHKTKGSFTFRVRGG